MKHKALTFKTNLFGLFYLSIFLSDYYYRRIYPELIVKINLSIAFLFLLVLILPHLQQQLKK